MELELFIEKEFLDDFYADFDTSKIKVIVKNMITIYGNKKVFINYHENDFESIKNENQFFAEIANTTVPIPILTVKSTLFNRKNYEQTIVFTSRKEDWFLEANKKGILCFSFENYISEIENMIEKLHFKIDLSENFTSWNVLGLEDVPFNSVQITDGYILSPQQDLNINLIPLLSKFGTKALQIDFLIKEIKEKRFTEEQKKEEAVIKHRLLNSKFANSQYKFLFYVSNVTGNFDFHDRTLITNFSILESGVGFSLIGRNASNSQLTSESIFEKYTYDRLHRLKEKQTRYIDKLNNPQQFQSNKFYKYP